MAIKLVVGLRNPGPAYELTRHNVGGWLVEALAEKHHALFQLDKKFHGESALLNSNGIAYRALLPLTFMNRSGQAVRAISQFYQIDASEILVVHDELDLPAGRIKLKTGGGHGGHNGLRDIISQLGANFHRLRIGIAHPGDKSMVSDYVLGKPSQQDKQLIQSAIDRAITMMPTILTGDIAAAMCLLNA